MIESRYASGINLTRLTLASAFLLLGASNALTTQHDQIYEKLFPRGHRLWVTKTSTTKIRSTKLTTVEPGGSRKATTFDEEYIDDAYSLHLLTPASGESKVVWKIQVTYAKSATSVMQYLGGFSVWDSFYDEKRICVLYLESGHVKVDSVEKDRAGSWAKKSSNKIGQRSEGLPTLKGTFLPGSRPRVSLEVLGKDQKVHNQIWSLRGRVWKRG